MLERSVKHCSSRQKDFAVFWGHRKLNCKRLNSCKTCANGLNPILTVTGDQKTPSLRPVRIRSRCHFPTPQKGRGAGCLERLDGMPIYSFQLRMAACAAEKSLLGLWCHWERLEFGISWHSPPPLVRLSRLLICLCWKHVGGSSRCSVPRELLLVQISGAFHQRGGFGAYAGAGESSSSS